MFVRLMFLSLLLVLGCAACEPLSPAEELLDDYLTRLARVLDTDKPDMVRQPLPRLPPHSTLTQTIAPLKIDLLDYWALRECGLTIILSERNSVLGRVMLPSQHLHMDGRILRQLVYCKKTSAPT